jgi:hypothetical protein
MLTRFDSLLSYATGIVVSVQVGSLDSIANLSVRLDLDSNIQHRSQPTADSLM